MQIQDFTSSGSWPSNLGDGPKTGEAWDLQVASLPQSVSRISASPAGVTLANPWMRPESASVMSADCSPMPTRENSGSFASGANPMPAVSCRRQRWTLTTAVCLLVRPQRRRRPPSNLAAFLILDAAAIASVFCSSARLSSCAAPAPPATSSYTLTVRICGMQTPRLATLAFLLVLHGISTSGRVRDKPL